MLKTYTIDLAQGIHQTLTDLAERPGKTKAALVRGAIVVRFLEQAQLGRGI